MTADRRQECQSLPKGVQPGQALIFQTEHRDNPFPMGTVYSSSMCLVHDEMRVLQRKVLLQIIRHRSERRDRAIHAVHRLDSQKETRGTFVQPRILPACTLHRQRKGREAVVLEGNQVGLPGVHPVVDRCVDVFVVDNHIPPPRDVSEKREVCVEAGACQQRRGRIEERGHASFEGLVSRSVREDPGAAHAQDSRRVVKSLEKEFPELITNAQAEIVVGRVLDALSRRFLIRSG
ncbi:unnamed protein product [Mycena citricolor]|uniref:Uncharacterized protein n=1 Tax=Mycena citricolor TaxID=2018698 RepID=A0AAD2H4Q2_9AGAR|nr:unnamed protein product [Mycena citricolor]